MKKITERKIRIFIIQTTFVLCVVFATLTFIYLNSTFEDWFPYEDFNPITHNMKGESIKTYEILAESYVNDPEVVRIAEKCKNSSQKVLCVYFEFPFTYDFERVRTTNPLILSPTKLIEKEGKGVCRDIAVTRHAIFKRMNMYSQLVLKPGHLYLKVYEDYHWYELNNEFLIK